LDDLVEPSRAPVEIKQVRRKWMRFFMSVDFDDLVVFAGFEYAFANNVDNIGLRDAAEPKDGVFRVGGFEVQVHQFE